MIEHLSRLKAHCEAGSLSSADVAELPKVFAWAVEDAPDQVPAFALAACTALPNHPARVEWLRGAWAVVEGESEGAGDASILRALGDLSLDHPRLARGFYYRALAAGESSLAQQAGIFKGLGDAALSEGDKESAGAFYYKAHVLYEVAGFKLGQANTLHQLAAVTAPEIARQHYQLAIRLYVEMGFELQQAESHRLLADLLTHQMRRLAEARTHYQAAGDLYGAIEFWDDQAAVLLAWGHLEMLAEDLDSAGSLLGRAMLLYQQTGHQRGQAEVWRTLGHVDLQEERWMSAAAHYEAAGALYAGLDAPAEAALMPILLADVCLQMEDFDGAAQFLAEALPRLDAIPDPLAAHEMRGRWRTCALAAGVEIPPEVQALADDGPPELTAALESLDSLCDSLPLAMDLLPTQPSQRRAAWLESALKLCDSDDPTACQTRALLLKERAGLPGAAVSELLHQAIYAYEVALHALQESPIEYGAVQNLRVALLRDMAGMPHESRRDLLFRALDGCQAALERLTQRPVEYAYTQLNRANLLRELAGLRGENRAHWMLIALAAYDEVLELVPDAPLECAAAQANRASLLQEVALLPGENRVKRLREAVWAGCLAQQLAESVEAEDYGRVAARLLDNLRHTVDDEFGEGTFEGWQEKVLAG